MQRSHGDEIPLQLSGIECFLVKKQNQVLMLQKNPETLSEISFTMVRIFPGTHARP